MKNIMKRIMLLVCILVLTSCSSGITKLNINGNYTGQGMMEYEAIVEDGTITIYSYSFLEKNVYWYGTCNQEQLNSENILVSKKLARGRQDNFFGFGFGFGTSMHESGVTEKQIKFTDKSLTFVYDINGMSVHQVTLYKVNAERDSGNFDSNADKLDPNYKEPTIDLPPPPGQTKEKSTEESTEESTEKPTEKNDEIVMPEGEVYSL